MVTTFDSFREDNLRLAQSIKDIHKHLDRFNPSNDSSVDMYPVPLQLFYLQYQHVLAKCTPRDWLELPALNVIKMALFDVYLVFWTKPEAYERKWVSAQEVIAQCCKILWTSNSSSETHGAATPCTQLTWVFFLGLEEPLLKLFHLVELLRMNSSPIFNCWHSKLAIFISCNINYNINSVLWLRIGTRIIYTSIYQTSITYRKLKWKQYTGYLRQPLIKGLMNTLPPSFDTLYHLLLSFNITYPCMYIIVFWHSQEFCSSLVVVCIKYYITVVNIDWTCQPGTSTANMIKAAYTLERFWEKRCNMSLFSLDVYT